MVVTAGEIAPGTVVVVTPDTIAGEAANVMHPVATATARHARRVIDREATVGTYPRPVERPGRAAGDTGTMGFDPQRRRVPRPSDAVFVVAAVVVAFALVAWAALG
jgi:hypothetical protein